MKNEAEAFRVSKTVGVWRVGLGKDHAVAHGKLLVRLVRRIKPNTPCSVSSAYFLAAEPRIRCLAHSH
jgi:hypothetical protein